MGLMKRILKLLSIHGFEHASEHWKSQRETAVVLLIFSTWFAYQLLFVLDFSDYSQVVSWASNPLNTVLLTLLSLYMIYHAELGVQVIIEDYISNESVQKKALFFVRILRILVILTSLFALLSLIN